jgi:hypothetical protein
MKEKEEQRTMHPSAPRLDAVAAGDDPGAIAGHLADCEACGRYVARLREEAALFRANVDAKAYAENVRARARARPVESRAYRAFWFAAPLVAAAAAVVLWAKSPSHAPRFVPSSAGEAEHFKGGIAVAAVLDRGGHQDRLVGPFEVRPSDRVRVEIAMDHEGPVTAGLLFADGSWATLLAPVSLGPGTHYSELDARFDDAPTDALLVVGAPDAVARARATRNFEGVVAWRIRSALPR